MNKKSCRAWWHMLAIPTLKRQKQEDFLEFEGWLGCRAKQPKERLRVRTGEVTER